MRFAAKTCFDFSAGRLVPAREGDAGPLANKKFDRGFANATGAARDQGRFSFKTITHANSLSPSFSQTAFPQGIPPPHPSDPTLSDPAVRVQRRER
jgi:hypothetical protein